MPSAKSTRQPSYHRHKATGQVVVTLNGKDIYLGQYGTRASKAKYDCLIAEWLTNGRRPIATASITLAEARAGGLVEA
jgi:hypothetical protein